MGTSNTRSNRPAYPAGASKPTGILTTIVTQSIALAVFVGAPAIATAIAPVSWITFDREAGQVSFTAKTCLLFLVPFETVTVDSVAAVDTRTSAGTVRRRKPSDPPNKRRVESEDQGFLVVRGPNQTAEVSITPANLDQVHHEAEAFLNDPGATSLRRFVVANWKFSVGMGGALTLLTVLYVVTVTLGIALKGVHVVQGAAGIPPHRRLLAQLSKPSAG